jgi:hypothetical protein
MFKTVFNTYIISHVANSEKSLRSVLELLMKEVLVPSIQKGQGICGKCRKTIAIWPEFCL